jgi:hypothetical protein
VHFFLKKKQPFFAKTAPYIYIGGWLGIAAVAYLFMGALLLAEHPLLSFFFNKKK